MRLHNPHESLEQNAGDAYANVSRFISPLGFSQCVLEELEFINMPLIEASRDNNKLIENNIARDRLLVKPTIRSG